MADQADIFSNESTTPPASDAPADLLATIKNEQGEPKYKTPEDAFKALANSQAFIETLKAERKAQEEELALLREKASKADNIDEVLAKLSANKQQEAPAKETSSAGGLDEQAIANLVKKALDERDNVAVQKTNLQLVQSTLATKFGGESKATEAVRAKAKELGTTPEKLGALSVENPSLVLALFGTVSAKPAQPTSSSVNLHTPAPTPTLEKPAKSLLLGATSKEQAEFMRKVKEDVYRKYQVTE